MKCRNKGENREAKNKTVVAKSYPLSDCLQSVTAYIFFDRLAFSGGAALRVIPPKPGRVCRGHPFFDRCLKCCTGFYHIISC